MAALYTVVVYYNLPNVSAAFTNNSPGLNFSRLSNQTAEMLKNLRDNIFSMGFYLRVDAYTGIVIPPCNLVHLEVLKQAYELNDAELSEPLVKPDADKPYPGYVLNKKKKHD